MKFFVLTCIKESQADAYAIFKQCSIKVFSAMDITGFKETLSEDLLEDWFAAGEARFDSLFLFSFTGNEKAEKALESVKAFNERNPGDFPLRAFIMPVEKCSF